MVPIATYGFRLWFFKGARNKGAMNHLRSMQRKAAVWITGAFRTSPGGGVEALAGLIPIHLHIAKLAKRALYRVATLTASHPTRELLSGDNHNIESHDCSISNMTRAVKGKVKSTIMKWMKHSQKLQRNSTLGLLLLVKGFSTCTRIEFILI